MAKKVKDRQVHENIRLITGWLFLAVGLYLLIAFGSYLFTWTVDQSLLSQEDILASGEKAANSGGILGNRVAHFFYWSSPGNRCFYNSSFSGYFGCGLS